MSKNYRLKYRDIEVTVQIKTHLKHTYLRFTDMHTLIVKTPFSSQEVVTKILEKKEKWIVLQQQRLMQKTSLHVCFGADAVLFGERFMLDSRAETKMLFQSIQKQNMSEQGICRLYDDFYKKQARIYLPQRVEYFAKQMQMKPVKIVYRKMKRRWGSCNSKKEITFNTQVMKLPPALIDYVIVHEMAHLRHLDHSKAFYALVSHYLPDAKQLQRQFSFLDVLG
jgi:predicted metal-dependent hydrolase